MNEAQVHQILLYVWFGLSVVTFLYLLFVPAPYGRHQRAGWGPQVGQKTAWVLMESPTVLAFAFFFLTGKQHLHAVPIAFFLLWQSHYLYRTFIFPFLLRGSGKTMPLVIVASGFTFNIVNAYLNGRYLFALTARYNISWFFDWRFAVGVFLFFIGYMIHFQSDRILRNLRKPGESGYKMPAGGLYRWVSCPNYLGELIEWSGWAIATWSLPGLAFVAWSAANLLPRAFSHHRWYRHNFAEYPPERRAIIPFLL